MWEVPQLYNLASNTVKRTVLVAQLVRAWCL